MKISEKSWVVYSTLAKVVSQEFNITNLLLQGEYSRHTTIHGVRHPGLRLIADGDNSVVPSPGGHLLQQLRHVAGPEHLVHSREPRRTLVRPKVRGEHAPRHALAPQELAGPAGGRRRGGRCINGCSGPGGAAALGEGGGQLLGVHWHETAGGEAGGGLIMMGGG